MKPPFKLGLADYVLIALTCGLVLLAIEHWTPALENWLRAVTAQEAPTRGGTGFTRPASGDCP